MSEHRTTLEHNLAARVAHELGLADDADLSGLHQAFAEIRRDEQALRAADLPAETSGERQYFPARHPRHGTGLACRISGSDPCAEVAFGGETGVVLVAPQERPTRERFPFRVTWFYRDELDALRVLHPVRSRVIRRMAEPAADDDEFVPPEPCPACRGSGWVPGGPGEDDTVECPVCDGAGVE